MTAPAEDVHVRTLLGTRGFECSIACLRSLAAHSADPIRLIVHEDGTLMDEHRERLAAAIPRLEFVSREQADRAVLPQLERYPRCRAARASGPLFLKLFDIALLADRIIRYCDSDILFLRRYRGVFEPVSAGYTFMADVRSAYSVRPWRVWPAGPIRLGARVNTGIVVGPAGLDLDAVEWTLGVLASDGGSRRPYWAEQTCWAVQAARYGFRLFDPRRIILARARMTERAADTVAIHFVATYRHHFATFADALTDPAATDEVVAVDTVAGRSVSAAGLLWTDISRRLVEP